MTSLQSLMKNQLPQGGIGMLYGRNSYMVVVEVATGRVRMSLEPANQRDYNLLVADLDDSLHGVGVGDAAMNAALFRYSPCGGGVSVQERDIAGTRFIHVAILGKPKVHPGGMMQSSANKSHVVGFGAGTHCDHHELARG